jgi:hypothetical protein
MIESLLRKIGLNCSQELNTFMDKHNCSFEIDLDYNDRPLGLYIKSNVNNHYRRLIYCFTLQQHFPIEIGNK